ncbi:hypothetical protein RI129_002046 [Pyrocoelia pectoralis]|uniref:Signal recognition particle 19 kDa protein n=1 Tax=Pyrocoelia pectoralis TaxID=417401 RepID=A0AAN7VIF5_9COLE
MTSNLATGIPLTSTSDVKHTDKDRWICIYPAYINSKKTLAQGRKIAKEKCVENPTHQEMRDVLVAAGLKVGVENKLYSREMSKELLFRGRIRVQLKNDDSSLCDGKFPTRESIMSHLGEMIPKLKVRQTKTGAEQHQASSAKGKNKGKGRK